MHSRSVAVHSRSVIDCALSLDDRLCTFMPMTLALAVTFMAKIFNTNEFNHNTRDRLIIRYFHPDIFNHTYLVYNLIRSVVSKNYFYPLKYKNNFFFFINAYFTAKMAINREVTYITVHVTHYVLQIKGAFANKRPDRLCTPIDCALLPPTNSHCQ